MNFMPDSWDDISIIVSVLAILIGGISALVYFRTRKRAADAGASKAIADMETAWVGVITSLREEVKALAADIVAARHTIGDLEKRVEAGEATARRYETLQDWIDGLLVRLGQRFGVGLIAEEVAAMPAKRPNGRGKRGDA